MTTPVDRLLTASLIVAPVTYLIADSLYAARGWDDPTAAVFHVLGAVGYALVLLRMVNFGTGYLAAALLLVGVLGSAGNVAYGFNTIHVSLGDTDLVDATGAAVLIKPLGLCFPLALLLTAFVLRRTRQVRTRPVWIRAVWARPVWIWALLAVAAVAWPVAHIANIGWLAVTVNVALVIVFGAVARPGRAD